MVDEEIVQMLGVQPKFGSYFILANYPQNLLKLNNLTKERACPSITLHLP